MEQLGLLEAQQRIVYRKSCKRVDSVTEQFDRGYVALAVARDGETIAREQDTGIGKHRTANMVLFACEALSLLKEVITARPKI